MTLVKRFVLSTAVVVPALLLLSGDLAGATTSSNPSGPSGAVVRELTSGMPLVFGEIRGEAFEGTRFLARTSGFTFLLTPTEPIWVLSGTTRRVVRMRVLGMSTDVQLKGEETLGSKTSYFLGSDPSKWQTDLKNHRKVRYEEIYPGIDLLFYGDQERLEYDFVVSPGNSPDQIRLDFKGVDSVQLGSDGRLLLSTPDGTLEQSVPHVYQMVEGKRQEIPGRYRLDEEGIVSFEVASYDANCDLVIDPVLLYSTYLGGTKDEVPGAVASDGEGNLYVIGSTGSLDFPLVNPFQDEFAGGGTPLGDVYVTKLDPSGRTILYSTYIGGAGTDIGKGLAVDSLGQVVATGTTFSGNFPSTAGAFQRQCSGMCPFVFKLSPDGSQLVYSTFIGRGDGGAVAVDSSSQAVVTGRVTSDFPTKNAFQAESNGRADAFVSKLTADGSDLVFSTFLGGSDDENLIGRRDIATDSSDNIYVVGRTRSDDFPLRNAVQDTYQGVQDAFVAKFGPQGSLVYSTYLGGTDDDRGQGIAADAAGNAYVVGVTESIDFPTVNAFQPAFGGGTAIGDAFVARIAPQGNDLVFSTYLGGHLGDTANDVALDSLGRVVVVGNGSSNFPVLDPILNFDGIDNYVTKLEGDGSALVYSTPIGAGDQDIAVTTFGTNVYVAGNTGSGNLPVLNALQPRSKGFTDTFLTHLADASQIYFAQFGNGSGVVSDILLTNSSEASPSNATLTFRADDGSPLDVNLTVTGNQGSAAVQHDEVSELQVTVEPFGVVRIRTDGVGDVVTGSVTVNHDGPLGGVIRFTLSPFGTAGVGSSELVRGFITPVRRTAINTGVAMFNPEDKATGITMRLRDLAGVQIQGGLHTRALQPGEHLALFITELFKNADLTDFEGTLTVEVSSLNQLITATALELGTGPGQFTTLPVTPIP